jgi:DivIVA domain-containing protein
MIDLASIRNASFTLTPTGYNPEEVDRFLADLADQLAALESRHPVSPPPFAPFEAPLPIVEQPPAPAPFAPLQQRPEADLHGLRRAIDATIEALEAFVRNELAAVKAASELEIDDIHRERERLLEEAAETARVHLDEARIRGEGILAEARRDGDEMRRRVEAELQLERDRFEQALADRNVQGQARIAELLAGAEERRRHADELVANAKHVQSQILASLESARASIGMAAPDFHAHAQPFGRPPFDAEPPVRPYQNDPGASDAAA